jgi:Carboxypeptidase regulatory-like domain/TonB-dependent Receptor Plug Domain
MSKWGLSVFAGLFGLSVVSVSPVTAQIQTGSVLIKVLDDQGAVVPGVTVTVTSPVLPREIVGVTDAGGIYQVPGLAVGTYTIKTVLQGFQTVIREDIVVRQGQVASVEISMKVSSLAEEITVKGESPVVDTKTVGSRVSIDKDLLDNTPGGKDIWNILEYKAPGVVVASPDVGGNQGGLQRSMSARGTPNAQNTQMLNGVNVNDPAAQGFSMNYYIPSAFENIEVSSGAQDIAVGTGGIFINMVTKSGSNTYAGSALQTYQGNSTQADNIDDELKQSGFRPNAQATDLLSNTNFQLGGPIIRNKLFFFGSFNFQATHVSVPGFPAVAPSYIATPLADTSDQDTTDILAGEGRVSYALNARNRFDGYLSKQRYDKPNRGANAFTTQDSNSKELDTFVVTQIAHNLLISDRMFLDSKISYNNTHFPLSQKTDLQPLNDTSTNNTLYRNRNSTAMMFRRRLQIVSNWQYYGLNFFGGRHDFKAGFDNGYTPEDVDTTRVDDVNLNFASLPTATLPAPRATTLTIFNSPLHQERAVMSTAFYGQDSYSIGRLTVVGGIRWERIEGYLPAQVTPASRYFPEGLVFQGVTINGVVQNYTVRKTFDPVRNNPLWYSWGPRVSGTYDLTGQGRTILKASWGKYLDQINTGTPPNPNANINQQYAWNDINGDLIFQAGNATWDGLKYVGGEFGALNSTNNLAVAVFDPTLRRPYRNQTTVSVDHELFPEVLLSVAYLRTREKDVQGTLDQSMDQWNQLYTPVQVTDPGRDGVAGTGDENVLTVFSLNQGAVTSTTTVNDDRLATRYDGLDMILSKRYSRGWNLLAGYTYSRTRVDLTSLANPNAVFVNAGGESGGRRHNFKASGSYMLPWNVLFAANFRLASGEPITRSLTVPTCSATVTTGCVRQNNLSVNAEPRGSVELGWLPTVDIRAGKFFDINGNRLELSVDVYNLGNLSTVWNVRTGTGLTPIRVAGDPTAPTTNISTFLSPTNVLGPQVVRFNVSYRFGQR